MSLSENALREIRNVRQVPGEPRRRWFFSHEMDLIVWFDEEDKPIWFQLSYDKHRIERTIRWKPDFGVSHWRVNDRATDDDARSGSAGAALLVPDGPFNVLAVRSRFLALSPTIPWNVTELVADRLRRYAAHQSSTKHWALVAILALLVIPVATVIARRTSRPRKPL